jgi:hypothetical protein
MIAVFMAGSLRLIVRRMHRVIAFAVLAALAPHSGAQAPQVTKVELQRCGLYDSKEGEQQEDAQSPSGKRRIVVDNRLVKETLRVPLRAGSKFGCEVVMHGSPAGARAEFRAVLRLPPGAPREQLGGSQSYTLGAAGYVGYTFRNPALFVAGPWTLQVWIGEKKMAERTFTVEAAK